jgi:hypothetical protein
MRSPALLEPDRSSLRTYALLIVAWQTNKHVRFLTGLQPMLGKRAEEPRRTRRARPKPRCYWNARPAFGSEAGGRSDRCLSSSLRQTE